MPARANANGKTREYPPASRFVLRSKLGEGGMGVVYRAWDRALGKDVALKRVRDLGRGATRHLKAEFRARSAVQHRNLVQLYELIVDGDDCVLTMELVRGTDLRTWVRGGVANGDDDEGSLTAATVREGQVPDALRGAAPGAGASPAAVSVEPRGQPVSGAVSTGEGLPWPDEPLPPPRPAPSVPRGQAAPIDVEGARRLRAVLADLCAGLAALHDAGVVHRDVTPANVQVTQDGRVVLLDFGLAALVTAYDAPDKGTAVAGTPRYMAPEQVRGEAATPAVDLYGVGGIVYELLTGQSAFGGSVRELVGKASGERPAPIAPGSADDELAALAMALLDPAPERRPTARQVQAMMRGATHAGAPQPPPFVGRRAELDAIDGALAAVATERAPRALLVEGPSGAGKTTLLRRALGDLRARDPGALILTSRCHPQESVPFKAVDAAVDALAQSPAFAAAAAALPEHLTAAVVRLFPVLAAEGDLAPQVRGAGEDDAAQRALGFEGIRALLGRITETHRVVLWIDDVQWDDSDSARLVEAVLRGRGAPPLLLLLTVRTDAGEGRGALVPSLLGPSALVPTTTLTLGPLDESSVASLAASVLGAGDERVARVVRHCEGNPFLAVELARYLAAAGDGSVSGVADVEALVAARIASLSGAERGLLEVCAVGARPLPLSCVLRAAGADGTDSTLALGLRDALLLRTVSGAGEPLVAPYHDKIAEAAAGLLPPERRVGIHRALAEALEAHPRADADAVAHHWEGAGEWDRAAPWAVLAADHAAAALAFGRAAALYEKALALGAREPDAATLLERAAFAHGNHGHGPAAAERYLDAARALGDDPRDARVRRLKRLAAEHFIESGYVRRGWEVMRSVLDAMGIHQPATPGEATWVALRRRLAFLARPLGHLPGPDGPPSPEEQARLDALWTASTSMSMVNVTLSDAFRTEHLRRILVVGDASSIARALAYEVALEAHVGGPLFDWHTGRLLTHARRLVARTGDPYDRAWLALGVANEAYCKGRFAEAAAACLASEHTLRTECRGVAWEIATVAAFLLTSLAMMGDLPALRAAAGRYAREAEGRGDLFGVAESYSGECVLAWWCEGSAEEALARAQDAVARQGGDAHRWPEKTYRRGQLTEVMGCVHLSLLQRDGARAFAALLAHWEGLTSAMVLKLQFYRSWVHHARARAALATAFAAPGAPTASRLPVAWTRRRLVADAERCLRVLQSDTRPFAPPWAALVAGALAVQSGEGRAARAHLARAVLGFDAAGMALYAAAARARLGQLAGSRALLDDAHGWLREQGAPAPETLVQALAPGYDGAPGR